MAKLNSPCMLSYLFLRYLSVPDETIVSNLERHGLGAYGRTVWRDLETGVHVVQAIVPGAERFHLLKFGYPIAPTGCYGRSVANQLLEGK